MSLRTRITAAGLLLVTTATASSTTIAGTALPTPAASESAVTPAIFTPENAAGADLRAVLHTTLERQFAASPSVPGISARVDGPDLHWAAAVGSIDRVGTNPLSPDNSFRVASVTKTFTAAAVLALVDRHRIDIHDSITRYLSQPYLKMLRNGGYHPHTITVRQLLDHTSGLYDFGTDSGYLDAVIHDMTHRWTPEEQVSWAMDHGRPLSIPGQEWHYSDTGYVLLARIVEAATGLPQATAYRMLLHFQRLGLTSTWFETLETAPRSAGERAHQYFIYPPAELNLDLYNADPSYDLYGGGGLVSTTTDLNRFFRALLQGHVISKSSLRLMLTTRASDYGPAGMGIFSTRIAGNTCWWHAGFTGVVVLNCPNRRLTISITVNTSLNGVDDPEALTDAAELATIIFRRLADTATQT